MIKIVLKIMRKTTPHLEVDDYTKDEDCSSEVHQVRQVLAVESFAEGANLEKKV